MIEVQNVTKRYGPVTAVNGVSFGAESGQILGLLGPNGAGKTTTMRILTGCIPPTEGQALIAGFDVFEAPVEAKRRTGYLPETPPLYPDMTVREYLTFASRISGVSASQRAARIGFAMGRTSIADVADRHCGKLSKGYRQRVGLAQAILHNPDVLILDEPTAGLDPKQIIETRELIKDLAGDHTIVLSTHILPEVAQTCEQVVIINKGRVVAVDTPENLTQRLGGSEMIRLEVDARGADLTSAIQAIAGVTNVSVAAGGNGTTLADVKVAHGAEIRQDLANAVVANGWGLLELRRVKASLEKIFLELTTEDEAEAEAVASSTSSDGDTDVAAHGAEAAHE